MRRVGVNLKWLCALALVCIATSGWAERFEVQGKVVHVDDGDTVILLVKGREQMKIRLSSIDAPESSHTKQERGRIGQPYSENSKRFLAEQVHGKETTARCFETDRYERSVCELFVGGASVNRRMVAEGWAWANQAAKGRYMRDRELPGLQLNAQRNHAGLWAGRDPISPWEWRSQCWGQNICTGSQ